MSHCPRQHDVRDGRSWFDFRKWKLNFPYSTTSRQGLEPTQPRTQWVLGVIALSVKRLGREDDHSHPSIAGDLSPLPILPHGEGRN
jgi:hypothetical protein